ncbi:MAG TPA: hydrogenase maturation nickel metallochaperone HypA [Gemmatimonadaceae bacterium]|jgi:hydrogenase nickel incorporation protein HypA/HybF
MHELSIAMSLVDIACEELERLGNPRVAALHVRIGPLSGVVGDALTFSFGLATDLTPLQGARLQIETTPIVARCTDCDGERTIPSVQSLVCPECGRPATDIIGGREMELVALELEDDLSEEYVAAHR